MNLVDLPLEIFFEIVQHINTLDDIISLSLTNHALYHRLVPRHTEYFEIRCIVNKVDFWKHLQENPLLCKRIRRLLLVQIHHKTRLPKPFDVTPVSTSPATTSEGLELLCTLLPQMNNLKTFRLIALNTPHDVSRFFTALTESKCVLEELKFGFLKNVYNFFPNAVKIPDWDFDWSRLSHLSFLLNSGTITEGLLSKILTGCPRLTELCLMVTPGQNVSHILTQGLWPNLKRIGLTEMIIHGGVFYVTEDSEQRTAILRSFFSRHPLLEVARLPADIYPSDFLTESGHLFPNIKSLSLPGSKSVPSSFASRLRHIFVGPLAQWDISFLGYLPNLQSCIINVERLTNYTHITDLAEHIPNIERLCIWTEVFRSSSKGVFKSAQKSFHLKKLTTLFLSDFFFLNLTQEKDQLLIDDISQEIPSLKYINANENGQPTLFRITKDPVTDAYLGLQYVSPLPTVTEIAKQWGNFLFYVE